MKKLLALALVALLAGQHLPTACTDSDKEKPTTNSDADGVWEKNEAGEWEFYPIVRPENSNSGPDFQFISTPQ